MEANMFSPVYVQTGSNTGWIWFLILAVVLLIVILWWFSTRRRAEGTATPSAMPVRAREEKAAEDLTRIEGIGPKVARVLNEAGITTFEDLARSDPLHVQKILNEAGLQMMNPEGWIEQPALAAKGDWEAMEQLQSQLRGGRRQ
jgi:LPXTG-motif cell wall-anchored protein